ncbi:MAG: glycyl-radical enzyme activating protein [Ruminococcaceae bacterium]|nr:glycyl-radical enzyme activating protein [Oscillospiraceae bacterium]
MLRGTVTNIQHFSVHDGPGVRTTVFFKGCPLRCYWCHNPETQNPRPELSFRAEKCIGCGECRAVCPGKDPAGLRFSPECLVCGACAKQCWSGAIRVEGREAEEDEIFAEITRDRAAYISSGGGVTFSGGEPLLWGELVCSLGEKCRREGIHVAIETSAYAPPEAVERAAKSADLVMCDIKAVSPELHRAGTGWDNGLILENIGLLSRSPTELILRTPVVPGFNDGEAELKAIGRFVASLPNRHVLELLPFHGLCKGKYTALGREFLADGVESPDGEKMEWAREIILSAGAECRINR